MTKNCKSNLMRVLPVAMLFGSFPVIAGHESGSGGGGIRCGRGIMETVEILDIWEGRTFRQLEYTSQPRVLDYIAFAANKLGAAGHDHLAQRVRVKSAKLYSQRDTLNLFAADGISILPPSDTSARFYPTGCSIVGVANFRNGSLDGGLTIDRSYFNKLDHLNQAALFVHEVIYEYLLEHHDLNDSRVVRLLTGCSLSQRDCEELVPEPVGLLNSGLLCKPKVPTPMDMEIVFTESKDGKPVLGSVGYITKVDGRRNAVRSTFVLNEVANSQGYVGNVRCRFYFPVSSNQYSDWGRVGLPARLNVEVSLERDISIEGKEFVCQTGPHRP